MVVVWWCGVVWCGCSSSDDNNYYMEVLYVVVSCHFYSVCFLNFQIYSNKENFTSSSLVQWVFTFRQKVGSSTVLFSARY